MWTTKLTAAEIEQVDYWVKLLHRDRSTALALTQEVCSFVWPDVRQSARRHRWYKRPRKYGRFKRLIPTKLGGLQLSVYLGSDRWERDQESGAFSIPHNTYRPSQEVLLVRAIKFPIWQTMQRKPLDLAGALGTWLWRYSHDEILTLFPLMAGADNFARSQARLHTQVTERFPPARFPGFLTPRCPTPAERQRVPEALRAFTPCFTPHVPPSQRSGLGGIFTGRRSAKAQWQQVHALLCPHCAGFAEIVRQYNQGLSRGNAMSDPDQNLRVPDCNGPTGTNLPPSGPTPLPPQLTSDEIASVRDTMRHARQRKRQYRYGLLRIRVDGTERGWFGPEACASEPVPVLLSASYVEVWGRDTDGDLLLAIFPLPDLEEEARAQRLRVKLGGGKAIRLDLEPILENGEVTEGRLRVTYVESGFQLWPPVAEWLRQLWPPVAEWLRQPVVVGVTGALLVGALLFGYDRVVRQPAHHALRHTVQAASDATIAAVHQMQEALEANWREATQRLTLQAAAQAREEASTAAQQLRAAMDDGFREVAQRLEHRIQHDLRAEVRAAIHEGFREVGRLRLLLAHAQTRDATVTVARQVRVLTVAANGTTFPYPTFGQAPPPVLAIGDGVRQFPTLRTEYHDYLAQWPDIFRQLGESLFVVGNLDGAIQVLDYLRHVPPYDRDQSLLFLLAESYKMRGRMQGEPEDQRQAIAVYDDMISRGMADRNPLPYHYAGWSYFELHDYDRALAYYDHALRIFPRYGKVFYNKALAYQAKGGLSAAERARLVDDNLQRALDLTLEAYAREGDTNPRIPFTLAILYTAKQEPAVALQYLARALPDRAYVVRAAHERAFAFFRDPAQKPYHTEFVALLDRYRPRAPGSGTESAAEPFDPSIFWE